MTTVRQTSSKRRDNERRNIIIKFVIMMVLGVVLFILATIAWFSTNTDTDSRGMGIATKADGFELSVSNSGSMAFPSLYPLLDSSIRGSDVTSTDGTHQIIRWRMADGDDELMPGSQGELQFTVTPADANLDYSISVTAYDAITHTESETVGEDLVETEVIDALTVICSDEGYTGNALAASTYLNNHILFFTGRHGTSIENYEYYGFISTKEQFELTLANGVGTIYWIWPNTFGQIALESSDTDYISGTPVLYSGASSYQDDRDKLTDYLTTNASDIFSGNESSYSSLITALYTARENSQDYRTEFNKLSEGYNTADQTIGKNVDYVLVHMIASQK